VVKNYFFILLASFGIFLALRTVAQSNVDLPAAPPVIEPARPPFKNYVAGAGIVEANTENISIATPIGGVVTEVFVKVGQAVRKGEPLLKIDDRRISADLEVKEKQLLVTNSELENQKFQLSLRKKISDKRAISVDDLSKISYSVQVAEARVKAAIAEVDSLKIEKERCIIRSPIDGIVLQLKTRVGEYAQASFLTTPLIIVGNVEPFYVRVDVDENDAWKIAEGSVAQAFLRGNPDINFPMQFVRFEPYVIPKRSLTGDSSERVDTRVLQVIFSINIPPSQKLFIGQLVDVYINSENVETEAKKT
jgi:HlyD family secretion protein